MAFPIPDKVHQILNPEGALVAEPPELPPEQLLDFYRWMVLGRVFSHRMVALQRQGRMGTFAPIDGQEAANVGLAAPLQAADWLAGSYREVLAYFVKGVPMLAVMETYKGYVTGKYPVEAHCLPMQIVLATQMQHAVGLAMGLKYDGQPQAVVSVCGDGASSEGDFNEALNFAGSFKAPIVFVVQNNGWAISVPRHKQSAAEYIAHRGPGFGMPGHIVDGNDILAVYQVVSACVERARAGEGPSLVELITYRLGVHTTADDPTKYRPEAELEEWKGRDPLPRFRQYLRAGQWLNDGDEEQIEAEVRAEIQAAVEAIEALPPQDPAEIFDLVYEGLPPQLQRQRADLLEFLGREGQDA
ncbi:MAG: pyruvate dehydrogenase (acetyl-transferring) E1 component subunit alpha [Anaerolineae bacterium]